MIDITNAMANTVIITALILLIVSMLGLGVIFITAKHSKVLVSAFSLIAVIAFVCSVFLSFQRHNTFLKDLEPIGIKNSDAIVSEIENGMGFGFGCDYLENSVVVQLENAPDEDVLFHYEVIHANEKYILNYKISNIVSDDSDSLTSIQE